jgi:hypothetical protein
MAPVYWQFYCVSLGPLWILKLLDHYDSGFEEAGDGQDEGFFFSHSEAEQEAREIDGMYFGFTEKSIKEIHKQFKGMGVDGGARPIDQPPKKWNRHWSEQNVVQPSLPCSFLVAQLRITSIRNRLGPDVNMDGTPTTDSDTQKESEIILELSGFSFDETDSSLHPVTEAVDSQVELVDHKRNEINGFEGEEEEKISSDEPVDRSQEWLSGSG